MYFKKLNKLKVYIWKCFKVKNVFKNLINKLLISVKIIINKKIINNYNQISKNNNFFQNLVI